MAEIIRMDGSRLPDLTTRDEFINGKTKLFDQEEAWHESERGYRFIWGNLSEKKSTDGVNWLVFGIRWEKRILEICHSAEMSNHAVLDATMMFLPGNGERSIDVWSDDNDLDESGAIYIDLDGTDDFSEKELREDVWETYITRMPWIAEEVLGITGQFKNDDTYIVRQMIDKPDQPE